MMKEGMEMAEYIDKAALLKSFDETIKSAEIWRDDCRDLGTTTEYADRAFIDFTESRLRVKNFPTIDAVEVVRCKDCKHNSLKRMSGNTYCDLGIGMSQLYDFCSLGERKDDG